MKSNINEIKKLQKIAGILKEDAFETQNEQLPENWVLIFNYSDGQIIPSKSGRSAEQVAIKIKEGDIKQGFPEEDMKFIKNANDFYTVETNEYHITDVIGSNAPNAEKIKELYELGVVDDDYDIWQTAFDLLESMKKSKPKAPKFSLDAFSLNEDDFDLSDNPLSKREVTFNDVYESDTFVPIMDNSNWEYERFGFGDVEGFCYVVELEVDEEEQDDYVVQLKPGLTTQKVIDDGISKGYFIRYPNTPGEVHYKIELESEMNNWINSLQA